MSCSGFANEMIYADDHCKPLLPSKIMLLFAVADPAFPLHTRECQLPTQLYFKKIICQNKRIGTIRRSRGMRQLLAALRVLILSF